MLAHVRGSEIIKIYTPRMQKSWLECENGDKVSPVVSGYTNGNDRVLPVVDDIQDTSTGLNIVRTETPYEVRANDVYRLITIRDMTQEEIDAKAEQEKTDTINKVYRERVSKMLATALWHTNKGTVPQQALASPGNFKQWLRSLG